MKTDRENTNRQTDKQTEDKQTNKNSAKKGNEIQNKERGVYSGWKLEFEKTSNDNIAGNGRS